MSAYTTGMINMSLPDYYKAGLIDSEGVNELSDEQLLNGYLIVNTYFKFTWHVKYPSIPCYIDKTTTVYPPPLQREAFITGPEFLLARAQGCKFNIKSTLYIIKTP